MGANLAVSPHCVAPCGPVGTCAHSFVSWSCGGWPSAHPRHFRIRWWDGGCPPSRHRCRVVRFRRSVRSLAGPNPTRIGRFAAFPFRVHRLGLRRAADTVAGRCGPWQLLPSLTWEPPACAACLARGAGVAAGSGFMPLASAALRVAPLPAFCRPALAGGLALRPSGCGGVFTPSPHDSKLAFQSDHSPVSIPP